MIQSQVCQVHFKGCLLSKHHRKLAGLWLQDDAQIGVDVLGWRQTITGVGHCRQVGCPESGIDDAVQRLASLGYKA